MENQTRTAEHHSGLAEGTGRQAVQLPFVTEEHSVSQSKAI